MIYIQYVQQKDKKFWFSLDKHLSEEEFNQKVQTKRGYVLFENEQPIGILRYHLFWDNTPFCTLLFIAANYQRQGYGKMLMKYWEEDMKSQGYGITMTSTQVDEEAQFFYRKLGYKDCGSLIIDIPEYAQPMELIMIKKI